MLGKMSPLNRAALLYSFRLLLAGSLILGCDTSRTSSATSNTDSSSSTVPTDTTQPLTCNQAAPNALRQCIIARSKATAACYEAGDAACVTGDAALGDITTALETTVRTHCSDNDYPNRSVDDLVGRLTHSCISESDSMAWRVFGGPHGAVWSSADADTRECLTTAHSAGTQLMEDSLRVIIDCAMSEECDVSAVASSRADAAAETIGLITNACPSLGNVIALDPDIYAERIAHQADCISAAGLQDSQLLPLTCGPTFTQFEGKRGEWVQVIVNSKNFNALCGDGSDYAFWVKLAPEGEPLDRVFIGLQGGGVCIFEEDCLGKSDGLFTAMDDPPVEMAISSSNPEISPYANWTQVYLPYCTQDVFAGGGAVEELGSITVHRFGSANLRTAVRMVRDVLWQRMDSVKGPGYRPDQLVAMIGGWSAGGYGTIYNYHWMLDDLQWPRTIAFPDAGLALDNGELLGVSGLGAVKIPAWGTKPNLPPYCFKGDCAVGPTLYSALSPRLKQVPEQQMMILTNPLDDVQMYDAYFNDRIFWLNTLRNAYCTTRDLPGINYYFTSVSSESIHVISLREELWSGLVDGETMKDWLWGAYIDPDNVQNRVEEADFVDVFPGVEPYPCDVAP